MSNRRRVVGVIDSGVDSSLMPRVVSGRAFELDVDGRVSFADDINDGLNHGTQTARALLSHSPKTQLCVAKVFAQGLATSATQIASAVEWLIEQDVGLINMSLGLTSDRASIRNACELARARGVVIIASSPAHGAAVYPAFYSSVISVTGDARCEIDEYSYLKTSQVEFGACVRSMSGDVAGASIAAAHFSGLLAQRFNEREDLRDGYLDVIDELRCSAQIIGIDQTPWLGPNHGKMSSE